MLVDGRNLYDPREVAQLAFTYRGVGLPPTEAPAAKPSAADGRSLAAAFVV